MHYQLKTCFISFLGNPHDINLSNEVIRGMLKVIDKF